MRAIELVWPYLARTGHLVRRGVDAKSAEDVPVPDLGIGVGDQRFRQLGDFGPDRLELAGIERPVRAFDGQFVGPLDHVSGTGQRSVHCRESIRRIADVANVLVELGESVAKPDRRLNVGRVVGWQV